MYIKQDFPVVGFILHRLAQYKEIIFFKDFQLCLLVGKNLNSVGHHEFC